MGELIVSEDYIANNIYYVRCQRVMLDEDLAKLYKVPTKRLNEQVRRNLERFPNEFAFRLNQAEWSNLKSQIATSSWGGRRKPPRAFTEHGVVMLANVLRSNNAIKMSVEVVRAFIRLRQVLAGHKKLAKEMSELKSFLLKHSNKADREFRRIWATIDKLGEPSHANKRQIGFDLNQ